MLIVRVDGPKGVRPFRGSTTSPNGMAKRCGYSDMGTRLHNYKEVREYLEKEHSDWIRALTPRHINAPADYWPQKVLAVSSANAAMQNYVSIYEHQTRPNPALAAVHGQAALLLRYDMPIYYVSRELLAAAPRDHVRMGRWLGL